jgi:NAD(P)-dependent dehydrogenase (short-subunit alcohol dehydrogenase family)
MYLCCKEAIDRMMPQKSGVILMTASNNGMNAHPFYTDYNVSKAGVILLGRTIALECAPYVRANSVCPGYVLTPMQRAEYTDEMLAVVNEEFHDVMQNLKRLPPLCVSGIGPGQIYHRTTYSSDGGETRNFHSTKKWEQRIWINKQ